MTISLELTLAVECCRWNFTGGSSTSIAKLTEHVGWDRFARLVQFHRIQGLAWAAVREAAMPEAMADSLGRDAQVIAAENLRATVASRTLLDAFETAGVPLMFLKGLTLGALAYVSPALKSAIDIDLLVDPNDLGKAAAVLRKCDFRLVTPHESIRDRTLLKWHGPWKESVWAKTSPPLQLDLHTRLADNPRLIPRVDVHSPCQLVQVGDGIRLPTLATDELFAYVAVHGASSAWFRLKWIADFAGFIHRCAPTNVEALYRRSQDLGAGRAAGQALLLADELFGSLSDSPALAHELRRDSVTVRLFRTALQLLTGEPAEPTERRWATMPMHVSQFGLLPGLRYKFTELSSQLSRRMTRPK